jgi:hypothetical protein
MGLGPSAGATQRETHDSITSHPSFTLPLSYFRGFIPEEAMMRLRELFAATNAGKVYARFIAASHHYRPH